MPFREARERQEIELPTIRIEPYPTLEHMTKLRNVFRNSEYASTIQHAEQHLEIAQRRDQLNLNEEELAIRLNKVLAKINR